MAKNKIGKLFDKTIVWGCSLNELEEKELLYFKDGTSVVLIDKNGVNITKSFSIDSSTIKGEFSPVGKIEITTTEEVDVSEYATAQVVDANLIPENIKDGVIILGITGTYTGETEEVGE